MNNMEKLQFSPISLILIMALCIPSIVLVTHFFFAKLYSYFKYKHQQTSQSMEAEDDEDTLLTEREVASSWFMIKPWLQRIAQFLLVLRKPIFYSLTCFPAIVSNFDIVQNGNLYLRVVLLTIATCAMFSQMAFVMLDIYREVQCESNINFV